MSSGNIGQRPLGPSLLLNRQHPVPSVNVLGLVHLGIQAGEFDGLEPVLRIIGCGVDEPIGRVPLSEIAVIVIGENLARVGRVGELVDVIMLCGVNF